VLAAAGMPAHYFPALRIADEQITVEPLLTPDNYATRMIELIKSATTKLYVQIPYIYAPQANDQFRALVEALKARIDAGLDVRIIMSQYELMGGALEQLKQFGFDMSHVRIQKNLHNKGFIVDSGVVVVGSQNWSDAGTQTNRDATLIIHNAKVAEYFEEIFIHD
jgi:phosphatidylserine/phosphatidylglycerophosphate/cardiolipin synthase-like enzyme